MTMIYPNGQPKITTNDLGHDYQNADMFHYPGMETKLSFELEPGDLIWMPVTYQNRESKQGVHNVGAEYRQFLYVGSTNNPNNPSDPYETFVPVTTKINKDPNLHRFELGFTLDPNDHKTKYLKAYQTTQINTMNLPESVDVVGNKKGLLKMYQPMMHQMQQAYQTPHKNQTHVYQYDSQHQQLMRVSHRQYDHYAFLNYQPFKLAPVYPSKLPQLRQQPHSTLGNYNCEQLSYLLGIPKGKRTNQIYQTIQDQNYQQLNTLLHHQTKTHTTPTMHNYQPHHTLTHASHQAQHSSELEL